MMLKSLIARIGVVVATALACSVSNAQSPGPELAPAPNARQIRPQLPEGVQSRAGHDERLVLQSADGASQVVQLHCALGPYAMVMLPSGELEIIEQKKVKTTTDPFVAATPEEIAESLGSAGFSDFKVATGTYYLFVYNCSDAFYLHSRSILESMLPGVVDSLKSWGLKIKRPPAPMVVIIMPSRAAYDAYLSMPTEVIAYYNAMTNHVVMYEDQEMWDAAPEYAAKRASYVIAHEGVHQLLANTGIHCRLANWPPWICEGLAEYYCPLKVNSSLVRKGNSELPTRTLRWTKAGMVNDLRMYDLLQMQSASGTLLKNLVEADEIDSDGYALAWGLVHYLASEKPDKFRAYMTDISKYEPLDPANRLQAGRPDSLFVKHFGRDFKALEQEIQGHLTSKKMQAEYVDPVVNQTHYVVRSVEKKGRSFAVQLVITTSPAAAKKWKEEESAANKKAKFSTKICKTREEALWQVKKLQQQ